MGRGFPPRSCRGSEIKSGTMVVSNNLVITVPWDEAPQLREHQGSRSPFSESPLGPENLDP